MTGMESLNRCNAERTEVGISAPVSFPALLFCITVHLQIPPACMTSAKLHPILNRTILVGFHAKLVAPFQSYIAA